MSTANGVPAGVQVPPPVTEIAALRGFGALLDARNDIPVGRNVGVGCGGAIVCIALLGGIGSMLSSPSAASNDFLGQAVVTFLFFFALGLGGYGIRSAVLGPRVYYLYPGGIVRRLRSGASAIAWPDAARLVPVYGKKSDAGKVLGYRLQARDGTEFLVGLRLANGRDPFVDQIVEQVRRNGGTVQ